MESKYDYDFFVIGGGSGGLAAAKKAAKLGAKVGLADFVNPSPIGTKWGLGGTCVNVGCIPKKLMHFASLMGEAKHDQTASGWEIDQSAIHNWSKMLASVNTHIKRTNWSYKKQLIEYKVKYYNAFATFKNDHTLILKNRKGVETQISAENILIATGGRPRYLNTDGVREHAITSDDIFWRKKPPGKTLVIGGGYIAVECAGFIKGMGYDVDILLRSVVLRGFDRGMVERIVNDMNDKQINFSVGSLQYLKKNGEFIEAAKKVQSNMDIVNGGVTTNMESSEEVIVDNYDTIVLAIGRVPETSKLGIENTSVKVNANGKISVNEKYQTNVDNIYVIGDIREGSPELTPVAIKEGLNLAKGLYLGVWDTIKYNAVATTIFSPLEYSKVGLSEEQAVHLHGEENVDVYHSSFKPLEWNFNEKRKDNLCYTKVVVKRADREIILGIHYVGPNAGEVMQGYALALIRETTFEELKQISNFLKNKKR